MKTLPQLRRLSTFLNTTKTHVKDSIESSLPCNYKKIPIVLPHRTMPVARGQDLDFVNIAQSYLIHSEWDKLNKLTTGLTPFRIKHILLKTRKDYVLSLEFFKWVDLKSSESNTLDVISIILHVLTKNHKFKSAESILRRTLEAFSLELDFPRKIFEALVYSYKMCESSPRVFDALFKTHAHMKKFRNASDCFSWMKEYGFYPTIESCNAYLSALSSLNRGDIVLSFYKKMCGSRISPNVYTVNMVIGAYCKAGKLEMAVQMFNEMEEKGLSHSVVSYNILIAGYCNKGLLSSAMKLKNVMEKSGVRPNDVTYNTLMNVLCKEGKLHEANKLFSEMKRMEVAPTTITYNTLINGYSETGYSEMVMRMLEEMSLAGIKADILTYNAVIMGLCKEGKTKKAAHMVKVSQLTDKQKVDIAKWFLLNSPPGEIQYVAKDIRALLKNERLYKAAVAEAFPAYNKSHMICLELPDRSGEVMVTSFSEIDKDEYLDPRTAQVAIVDHVKQVCQHVRPAKDEELASSYIEEYRCALDAEIIKYVSEAYPKGVCSVYCINGKDVEEPGSDFDLVVVISAARLSPQNFCNGSWRSVWNLEFKDELQLVEVRGWSPLL